MLRGTVSDKGRAPVLVGSELEAGVVLIITAALGASPPNHEALSGLLLFLAHFAPTPKLVETVRSRLAPVVGWPAGLRRELVRGPVHGRVLSDGSGPAEPNPLRCAPLGRRML